jgi:flagellar hook-associated protein 1 FlgK
MLTNQTFTTGTATGTATFTSPGAGLNVAGSFTINGGNVPVSVQVTAGMTPQNIVTAINSAAATAGSTVTAQITGNGIYQVQLSSGGTALTFSNVTGNALSSLGLASSPNGHLGAATTTYGGLASNLIADIASRATAAKTDSTAKTTTLTALQTTFSNQSGVNVDQQTAMLTQLQNLYAASARVITTQTAMFNSLIQAVGG